MLKDKNLQKFIQYKVGKFGEELCDEDLKKIYELTVNNIDFLRKEIKYKFNRTF